MRASTLRWVRLAVGLHLLAAGGARADTSPGAGLTALADRLHAVRVSSGEQVELRVDGDGTTVAGPRSALSPAEAIPEAPVEPKIETLQHAAGPPAASGRLVAAFQSFGGKSGVLRVANGLDHPVLYDAATLTRRGTQLVVTTTSICPVVSRGVGTEVWGGAVEGVLVYNVREPPHGDLSCSRGSGLNAAPALTPANICTSDSAEGSIVVRLAVDPVSGTEREREALWVLKDAAAGPLSPRTTLVFPMQREEVARRPIGLQVLAFVDLQAPPRSKSASIVLLADGVEIRRRPWRLYADRGHAPAAAPNRRPVAFAGSVPFPLREQGGGLDPQLQTLFARIGDGQVARLEVRVEGDDGARIGQAGYDLRSTPLRDPALIAAAARRAADAARSPGHCAKAL